MIYEALRVFFLNGEHLFICMSEEQKQQKSGITSRSLFHPEVMITITVENSKSVLGILGDLYNRNMTTLA